MTVRIPGRRRRRLPPGLLVLLVALAIASAGGVLAAALIRRRHAGTEAAHGQTRNEAQTRPAPAVVPATFARDSIPARNGEVRERSTVGALA